MEHASPSQQMDYLLKLANVAKDCQFAEKIGYSKQQVSAAKKKGISLKMLAVIAEVLHIPLEEIKERIGWRNPKKSVYLNGQNQPLISSITNPVGLDEDRRQLWDAFQKALDENRKLVREKEALLRENEELKVEVATLKAQLTAGIKGEATATESPAANNTEARTA